MGTIFWFTSMLVLLGFEACTAALVCIWFAAGACASFFLSLFVSNMIAEWIVFVVVSAASFIPLRPYLFKKINGLKSKHEIGLDTLIGEVVKVDEDIDNISETGRVTVKGQSWSARTEDNSVIKAGELVKIKEIRGVKLIVEKN